MAQRVPLPVPPQKLIEVDDKAVDRRGLPTQPFLLWLRNVDLLAAFAAGGGGAGPWREVLLANRTYFVRTTGNDANDGLSLVTPFLTIQRAIDAAALLDTGTVFQVTIDIGPGTFTQALTLKYFVGSGRVTLQGAGMASTIISVTGAPTISAAQGPCRYAIRDMKLESLSAFQPVLVGTQLALLVYSNIDWGQAGANVAGQRGIHVMLQRGAQVVSEGASQISGPFAIHWYADTHANITDAGQTITISAAVNMDQAFAWAIQGGQTIVNQNTFVNPGNIGGTGIKFFQDQIGFIFVNGAGINYLPGVNPGIANQPFCYI